MAGRKSSSLKAGLRNVLHSSKYSDVVIRCKEREWKVHRAVVCSQVKFFAVACDGDYKEAQTNTIILEEDDPAMVDRMIKFLYTQAYDDEVPLYFEQPTSALKDTPLPALENQVSSTATLEDAAIANRDSEDNPDSIDYRNSEDRLQDHLNLSRALVNIAMYALAEKYDVRDLKVAAMTNCRTQAWAGWPLESLLAIAKEVYSSTPSSDRGLRNKLVHECADHALELISLKDWESLICDNDGFSFDLVQKVISKHTVATRELDDATLGLHYYHSQRAILFPREYEEMPVSVVRRNHQGVIKKWKKRLYSAIK